MKTPKLHKQRQELQAIVHCQNLYGNGENNGRRFYCPAIVDGKLTVEDMYTGNKVEFENGKFRTGYGSTVEL
jgi:hypothetical protein